MPLYPLPVAMMLLLRGVRNRQRFAGDFTAAIGGLIIIAAGALVYRLFRPRT